MFKELPEAYYMIHKIGFTVYVEKVEAPETLPAYIVDSCVKVVHDGRKYREHGRILNDLEVEFKTYEDTRNERKSFGARISHITRRINSKEPLTGKTLELALDIIGDSFPDVSKKLEEGEPLSDYEQHLIVDMRLVHARLS